MTAGATFPATEAGLAQARDYVEQQAQRLMMERERLIKLLIMVEELFTNVLRHAPVGESDGIAIALRREDAHLWLVFEDPGPPHDPFASLARLDHSLPADDRPPGGFGLLLVDAFADRKRYERVGGCNRVSLCLERALGPRSLVDA